VPGFELAIEDNGGRGEFLFGKAELGAKENLGGPAPGQSHKGPCLFQVAAAGQEGESFLDEVLRNEWNKVVFVPAYALAVGRARPRCFNAAWIECQFTVDEFIQVTRSSGVKTQAECVGFQ
jgi:hypothetical protein